MVNKSPIEYFEAQSFDVGEGSSDLSSAEQRFLKKYLGVNPENSEASAEVLESLPKVEGDPDVVPHALDETISFDRQMRQEAQVQLVGFEMDNQLFTIPTMLVQEVVRTMDPSHLPVISKYVVGVVNLRGHVTPLIRLRDILECSTPKQGRADRFTIICRCRGLQVGILIDVVKSMYRIDQKDIQWNIEMELGINGECIAALFKFQEKLVPIISVERLVDIVLQESITPPESRGA